MNRLLWAVAGAVVFASGVHAAEPPAAGKERTLLEQEFFLPDQPMLKSAPVGSPSRPTSRTPEGWSVWAELKGWMVSATVGQLGVCPTVRKDVW
ncbi:MAG: hypothetical protein MUF18_00975 [Fimbriiglobus sp.]|jgi:hypothetical protein|nr:hypothetical protein [Fimbriiglobus sp.]